jgi:hypothetical protein
MTGWEMEFSNFEETHYEANQAHDPAMHEQFEKAFEQAGQGEFVI